MSLITWTRTARRLLSRSTRVRAEGAPVAVHYHRGASGAENVGGAITLQADLTDEVQVDILFTRAREALGTVDVCHAAAKSAIQVGLLPTTSRATSSCSPSDELSGHVTGELDTVAGGMEGRTLHS